MEYQAYNGLVKTQIKDDVEENLECLKRDGFFVLKGAIEPELVHQARIALDKVWNLQVNEFGEDFLRSISELGVVRTMMVYDPFFYKFVRYPTLFNYVERIIGSSAILHLQNGILLQPGIRHNQARFHKDFPRDFISTKVLSLNTLIAIDPFNAETGGTWYVPGSHLIEEMPSDRYLEKKSVQVVCEPGDVLFFDSQLWHRGGDNKTSSVRRAINQQFTRPFIKQQIDYPHLLKDQVPLDSPLAQTLGMWAIPPKSAQQFRVKDPKLRTYRGGQG